MRIHGKKGIILLGLHSGDVAQPVAFLSQWNINFVPEYADATAYGDANRIYVPQADTVSGDFEGYYDDRTVQSYVAAKDGLPRDFALYPDSSNPGTFWSGSVIVTSFAAATSVADATRITSAWAAAGPITETVGGVAGATYGAVYGAIYTAIYGGTPPAGGGADVLDEAGGGVLDESGVTVTEEG
jgi:hypothetical protein